MVVFNVLFQVLALPALVYAHDFPLKVNLGYSTYEGVAGNQSVSSWIGIRYAAPPLGDLRFRAPRDPLCTGQTVLKADTYGGTCRSSPSTSVNPNQTEDCLFLNVYRPRTNKKNLPVYLYIGGGGLNSNSEANKDGANLVRASGGEIIVISFNYRVGPYGFLASKEVQANGDLNVGMLDQRKVLHWTQSHIRKFGGDPSKVTLAGASAGAGSVNVHLLAYGGRIDNLFSTVHAESPSFGYVRTVQESQYQYDALVSRLGCSCSNDTLTCLRNLPESFIPSNNPDIETPNGGGGKAVFMWSNVIDGDLIRDTAYSAFAKGKFVRVPSIYGSDTNEGTVFTPKNLNTTADMNNFLKNNFPKLTAAQLERINALYPLNRSYPNAGNYWRPAADAYGDMRYVCPSLNISSTLSLVGNIPQTYNYRWDVIRSEEDAVSGIGVRHVAGIPPLWGLSTSGSADAAMAPYIQGYITSFVRTAGKDVNKYRKEGSPVWEEYKGVLGVGRRLRFGNGGFIGMESVVRDGLGGVKQCEYLGGIGAGIGQ